MGYWGAKHGRVLHRPERVSEVALIDPRRDRLTALTRAFPCAVAFTDVEDALRHIDALVIATPPITPQPLGLSAVAAGKQVLIERPLAGSTRGATGLVAAASGQAVTLTGLAAAHALLPGCRRLESSASRGRWRSAALGGESADTTILTPLPRTKGASHGGSVMAVLSPKVPSDDPHPPGASRTAIHSLSSTVVAQPVTSQSAAPPWVRRGLPGWLRNYVRGLVVLDCLLALLSAGIARGVRPDMLHLRSVLLLAAFPLLWAAVTWICGGYRAHRLLAGSREFAAVALTGLVILSGIAVTVAFMRAEFTRGVVLIAVPATALLGALGRLVGRACIRRLRAHGMCLRRTIAVGRETAVLDLAHQLRCDPCYGMELIGTCVADDTNTRQLTAAGIPVLGRLAEAATVARRTGADSVLVTSASETAATYLRRLCWELEGSGIELLVSPGVMEVAGPRLQVWPFVGRPLLMVNEPVFTGGRRFLKSVLDRAVAFATLLLLSPVLLLIAVAIRLDSPGPVLYRQQRVGKDGRPFTMYKFRSMVDGAHAQRDRLDEVNLNADGLLFKVRDDHRVTRVGRMLRRYSMDELPQLLNVVAGTMSLVGPRPPLPEEVARYEASVHRRLRVLPGLTGLWQISGRSDLSWEDAVRLDLRYVENWSLSLDLLILWKTLAAVIRARGAY